jgi:hypothetical protein
MKKNIHVFLSIIFSVHLSAHDITLMPGYKNSLANIQVFREDHGPVVRFSFTESDPVCMYVPRSADESNNPGIKRYHIPLSSINSHEIKMMTNYVHDACRQLGLDLSISISDAPCEGLECLFRGSLQVTKQIDADNKTVSFQIARAEH